MTIQAETSTIGLPREAKQRVAAVLCGEQGEQHHREAEVAPRQVVITQTVI